MRRSSLLVLWIGALLCALLTPLAARGQAFNYQACLRGEYYDDAGFPQVDAGGTCDVPDCPTLEAFCAAPEHRGVGVTACIFGPGMGLFIGCAPTPRPCPCDIDGCGDGQLRAGEACDDGNAVDGDGCDGNCTRTGCGNGRVTAGETCDDGNRIDGDGCDGNCTVTACGNGVLGLDARGGVEACDDGNTDDGDGCDRDCTFTGCGNGITTSEEDCDDANDVSTDACVGCRLAFCGDGHVRLGIENCDDGNAEDDDGCTALCTRPTCGNGRLDADEECDDGNHIDVDDCRNNCLRRCEAGNCVCAPSGVGTKISFSASFPAGGPRKVSVNLPYLGKGFEGELSVEAKLESERATCANNCVASSFGKVSGAIKASLLTEEISGSLGGGVNASVDHCKVCNEETCSEECREISCRRVDLTGEGKVGYARTFPLFPEKSLTWGPVQGRIGCSAKLGCELSATASVLTHYPGQVVNCPACDSCSAFDGSVSLSGTGSLGCKLGLRAGRYEASAKVDGSVTLTGEAGYKQVTGSGCGEAKECAHASVSASAKASGEACINLSYFNAKADCKLSYEGSGTADTCKGPSSSGGPLEYKCSVSFTLPGDCSKKCERTCRRGIACGDSCIAANKVCHQPPGKACQGPPPEVRR